MKDIIKAAHGGETLRAQLEAFVSTLEDLPNFRAAGWHPSEFADMCARHHVLGKIVEVKDKPFVVDVRLRRIFDVGHALHGWYQQKYLGPAGLLWGRWRCSRCRKTVWGFMPRGKHDCDAAQYDRSCTSICYDGPKPSDCNPEKVKERGGCNHCGIWGEWLFEEVPIEVPAGAKGLGLKVPLPGHSDGLVTDKPWEMDGTWSVFELKTINDRGFHMLPGAKQGHRNQAEIYGRLIQLGYVPAPKGVEVPIPEKGIVFYVGKNTSEEKEFPFDLDKKHGDFLLSQPLEVELAFKVEELPNRHPECSSMFEPRAKKCPAASFCFGGKDYGQLVQIGKR